MIESIKISDLWAESTSCIDLQFILETILQKVTKNKIDDLDLFPYPIWLSNLDLKDHQYQKQRKNYIKNKAIMNRLLMQYLKLLRKGKIQLPKVI